MDVFFNNGFVSNENARLHISDLSLQRGYAVFDFCRTVNGIPLFLPDHLDRFYISAAALHLEINKTREELTAIVKELVKRSTLREAGIRFLLTGGYSADGYHPATPNLLITCNSVKTATGADFEKGYSVITHAHQRELPHVKTINYITAVWLQPLLKEKQADDVLYYNPVSITEFPRCNVFMVTGDRQLVTPARNMLPGVTRKKVITLAADIIPVEERNIPVEELHTASEIFLTATTKRVIPVLRMDGRTLGDGKPGPVTRKLFEKFLELEKTETGKD